MVAVLEARSAPSLGREGEAVGAVEVQGRRVGEEAVVLLTTMLFRSCNAFSAERIGQRSPRCRRRLRPTRR